MVHFVAPFVLFSFPFLFLTDGGGQMNDGGFSPFCNPWTAIHDFTPGPMSYSILGTLPQPTVSLYITQLALAIVARSLEWYNDVWSTHRLRRRGRAGRGSSENAGAAAVRRGGCGFLRGCGTYTSSVEPIHLDHQNQLSRSSTVRLKIIGNEIIQNVGQYESCLATKLPIIFKRTRSC